MKCKYPWYAGFCSQMRHVLFFTVSFSRSWVRLFVSVWRIGREVEKWLFFLRTNMWKSSCGKRVMQENVWGHEDEMLFAWALSLMDFSLKIGSIPFRSLWLFSISNGANSSFCFHPHIFNIQLPKPEESVPSNCFDTFCFCISRSHFGWFWAQSSDFCGHKLDFSTV